MNSRGILVIGAGRSTYHLHKYLAKYSERNQISITIADLNLKAAQDMCFSAHSAAIKVDINQKEQLDALLENQGLVVSMLPAHLLLV